MNNTAISIFVVAVLIGGAIIFTRPQTTTTTTAEENRVPAEISNNVTTEDVPTQADVANTAVVASTTIKTAVVKDAAPRPKTQVVEITAKGGYTPKISEAKAGMPTILRMKTQSTYDCTSSVNIPTLNIRKILPPDGATDIPLPPQKLGTSVTILCGMGMYNSVINFN